MADVPVVDLLDRRGVSEGQVSGIRDVTVRSDSLTRRSSGPVFVFQRMGAE